MRRLYYPLLKIRPRTPPFPSSFPPERFLRPHPKGLRLCFKSFLPWHCPLSGGLGQVFVYVAGARFEAPLLEDPSRSPLLEAASRSPPSRNPLCEKREASLFEAPSRSPVPPFFVLVLGLPPPPPPPPLRSPQPHIQKLAPLVRPLLKTHPRTPHFLSSFPPERFLRPPARLLLCFKKFFLPLPLPSTPSGLESHQCFLPYHSYPPYPQAPTN